MTWNLMSLEGFLDSKKSQPYSLFKTEKKKNDIHDPIRICPVQHKPVIF